MINSKKILLVGCGKMGFAILKSWVDSANFIEPQNIYVIEPDASLAQREKSTISKINFYTNIGDFLSANKNIQPDFILLAIKPQSLTETLQDYKVFDNGKTVFVSILAGKKIAAFQKILSSKTPIVRTMPNLPALVGQGITAIFANKNTKPEQLENVQEIFSKCGDVIKLTAESQFDAVTAVSGSGPAYIFHLIECMIAAAQKQKLPAEITKELVIKTVLGSAILAANSTDDATTLRKNVTSKAGTTEAALNILMKDNKMQKLFEKAIKAAAKRSVELSK